MCESRSVISNSLRVYELYYTVHGILQARVLEWVAFPFSRGASQTRDQTQVFRIAGGFFTSWATREDHESVYIRINNGPSFTMSTIGI